MYKRFQTFLNHIYSPLEDFQPCLSPTIQRHLFDQTQDCVESESETSTVVDEVVSHNILVDEDEDVVCGGDAAALYNPTDYGQLEKEDFHHQISVLKIRILGKMNLIEYQPLLFVLCIDIV